MSKVLKIYGQALFIAVLSALFFTVQAQAPVVVEGKVLSDIGNTPVEFGTITIPEARIKTRVNPDGSYRIVFPRGGEYTILISSPGLRPLKTTLNVTESQQKNFILNSSTLKGSAIRIRAERDVQKISRNTLTKQEIKDAPATFGDSLGALATLPGVIRPAGFFGPLIIRGASDKANRYYIDDIPVLNPQHFGGLQSIISNDLIREIDLFSSAFPVKYGNAIGAVIDINTVDEVKKFGGFVDIGLISANFLLQSPWGTDQTGKLSITGDPEIVNDESGTRGYWITSGRIGYLTLLVPPLVKLLTGDTITELPEYYDYQLKGNVALDAKGHHNLTLLVFGSFDTLRFLNENLTEEERAKRREEGQDPLGGSFTIRNRVFTNSQGIYYDYTPSTKLSNRLVVYGSFTKSLFFVDLLETPVPNNLVIDVTSEPNLAGLKERFKWQWWENFAELRTSLEYEAYFFTASGTAQAQTRPGSSTGQPDLGDPTAFQAVTLDGSLNINQLVAGTLENKFTYEGATFVPGARVDFLSLTKETTVSPRGLLSYEFPTETTISVAGGQYFSFPQINLFYFNQPFDQQPQVTFATYLKPEESIHRSAGVEQKLGDFSIKLEGFWNNFSNLLEAASAATNNGRVFSNNGQASARGVEILIRKNQTEAENEFYGWVSYTYTEARRVAFNITRPFEFEQPHSLKLIAGYRFGRNNIGTRFEFFSGFPYTPIVGSSCTPGFTCATPSLTRYSQTF